MRRTFRLNKNSNQKKSNKLIALVVLMILMKSSFAQDLIEISGNVVSQDKQEPLAGVAISIKGTVTGTVTSNEDAFILRTKQKLPFTLLFTSIGFAPQEVEVKSLGSKLQVALATQTVLGTEIVV